METGKVKVLNRLEADKVDLQIYNEAVNSFRIAINNSLTKFNMIDGIIDEYEDETGVDLTASLEEAYDATDDFYSPNNNTDIKLLLHLNGDRNDSSFKQQNFSGNGSFDAGDKQFGSHSIAFSGNDFDFISRAMDTDYSLFANTTDSRVIDCWVNFDRLDKEMIICTEVHTTTIQSNHIEYRWENNNRLRIHGIQSASTKISLATPDLVTPGIIQINTWHHVVFAKIGNELGIYVDGNQVAYKSNPGTLTWTHEFALAWSAYNPQKVLDGNIDEFRITHGNDLNLSPQSDLTDTYTVPTQEYGVFENMSLISNSFIAESQPDNGRIIILEEDIDTAILNTDIKAHISRDGGTTFTEVTLTNEGNFDTNIIVLTGEVDISSQPAGTSMVYKVENLNGTGIKIHGTGLSWD